MQFSVYAYKYTSKTFMNGNFNKYLVVDFENTRFV